MRLLSKVYKKFLIKPNFWPVVYMHFFHRAFLFCPHKIHFLWKHWLHEQWKHFSKYLLLCSTEDIVSQAWNDVRIHEWVSKWQNYLFQFSTALKTTTSWSYCEKCVNAHYSKEYAFVTLPITTSTKSFSEKTIFSYYITNPFYFSSWIPCFTQYGGLQK